MAVRRDRSRARRRAHPDAIGHRGDGGTRPAAATGGPPERGRRRRARSGPPGWPTTCTSRQRSDPDGSGAWSVSDDTGFDAGAVLGYANLRRPLRGRLVLRPAGRRGGGRRGDPAARRRPPLRRPFRRPPPRRSRPRPPTPADRRLRAAVTGTRSPCTSASAPSSSSSSSS